MRPVSSRSDDPSQVFTRYFVTSRQVLCPLLNTHAHLSQSRPPEQRPSLFTRQHTNSGAQRAAFLSTARAFRTKWKPVQSLICTIGLLLRRLIQRLPSIGPLRHVIRPQLCCKRASLVPADGTDARGCSSFLSRVEPYRNALRLDAIVENSLAFETGRNESH